MLPYRNLQFFILIVLFLILLPWLFNFQKENKWDSKIGELSYPIYICHMLIVMVAGYLLKQVNNSHETFEGSILIITLTILFSILLNLTVGKITEKTRRAIKLKQK